MQPNCRHVGPHSSEITANTLLHSPDVEAHTRPLATSVPPSFPLHFLEDEDTRAFLSNRISDRAAQSLRIPTQWHHAITGNGQEFADMNDVRSALKYFAVAKNFTYKFSQNDSKKLTVVCRNRDKDGCKWRMYVSRLKHSTRVAIKTFHSEHTCGSGNAMLRHNNVTQKWLAFILKPLLRERPLYRPCDLVKDVRQDFGIKIPYKQAWLGKETASAELYGSAGLSYDLIRWYIRMVVETNPGSWASVEKDLENRFSRLFVCFRAPYDGFVAGCRPLIFLDGTFLKDRYRGTLLAATALDANNGIYPLAYCVCDTENVENWGWFMDGLSKVLNESHPRHPDLGKLVFMSDMDKGLIAAIKMKFPYAKHSFCILHLAQNYKKSLIGKGINSRFADECATLLKSAAYKYTSSDFTRVCRELAAKEPLALDVLYGYEPGNWANSLFAGKRYGHLTSNCAESYNNWIRAARSLPIIQMLDQIRIQMMELMARRRDLGNKYATVLCSEAEKDLHSRVNNSRGLLVAKSLDSVYEVFDERTCRVDLEKRTCTCRSWDLLGIPCRHACAVLRWIGQSMYPFCDQYFTVSAFRRIYEPCIYPIPNFNKPAEGEQNEGEQNVQLLPPRTRRVRGRPKTRRIETRDIPVRPVKCSRCNKTSHNCQTCAEPIG